MVNTLHMSQPLTSPFYVTVAQVWLASLAWRAPATAFRFPVGWSLILLAADLTPGWLC